MLDATMPILHRRAHIITLLSATKAQLHKPTISPTISKDHQLLTNPLTVIIRPHKRTRPPNLVINNQLHLGPAPVHSQATLHLQAIRIHPNNQPLRIVRKSTLRTDTIEISQG